MIFVISIALKIVKAKLSTSDDVDEIFHFAKQTHLIKVF